MHGLCLVSAETQPHQNMVGTDPARLPEAGKETPET